LEKERVLGADIESTPLIVVAVLAGLALSAAAASDLRRRRAFLLVVVVIALAWDALDLRELLHQIDESREGLAAVAIVVAVLHLLAATVAGRAASDSSPASA
jgi:cytochrome b561